MIAAEHPRRFGSRTRMLREQYDDMIRQVSSFGDQAESSEEIEQADLDATDLRNRVGSIIRAIHGCRARQTDLVYDALRLDLGAR